MIPYGRQTISAEDIAEVTKVLRSDWITQGPNVDAFEHALAKYCGSRYAVAVASGTAALHLSCLASGLKKGDEAITSPNTFLATVNSIVYAGAKPVFADISPSDANIDLKEIENKMTKRTKAILPVHFTGIPCDIKKIRDLTRGRKITVIEDGAHALGAKYKTNGRWYKVGDCRHSDMTIFSFHPLKHITTGEGGAVTTNDKKLYEKLRELRNHGMYKDKKLSEKGAWMYEMRSLGFNYRITDIQCALGLSQLRRVDTFIKRRKEIAGQYTKAFKNLPHVKMLQVEKGSMPSCHIFVLKVNFQKLRTTRAKFVNSLKKKGIATQVHYIPVYLQPYYQRNFRINRKGYPNMEAYYRQCLTIPLYPSMTNKDVKTVIRAIKELTS